MDFSGQTLDFGLDSVDFVDFDNYADPCIFARSAGGLTLRVYCILYIFCIFLRSAPGLARHFLYGLPARSSRFGDTHEHRYIYIYRFLGWESCASVVQFLVMQWWNRQHTYTIATVTNAVSVHISFPVTSDTALATSVLRLLLDLNSF